MDGTCQLGATAGHSSIWWSHHMISVQLSAHEWRLAETTGRHSGFTSLSRQSSLSIHDTTCNATHYAGKIVPESRSDWGYWCSSATLCYSKATTVDISRKCGGGEINWLWCWEQYTLKTKFIRWLGSCYVIQEGPRYFLRHRYCHLVVLSLLLINIISSAPVMPTNYL